MKLILVFFIFGLLFLSTTTAQEVKSETQDWNLDSIYPSEEDWQVEVKKIQSALRDIEVRKKEISSATVLSNLLDEISTLRGRAGKLAKVGLLRYFTDTTNEQFIRKMEQSEFLESQVESAVGFINDAILSIPEEKLQYWRDNTPSLSKHSRRINRIIRSRDTSLPPFAESVLADLSRLPRTANDLYRGLLASDLKWPIFQDVELTPSEFARIRREEGLKKREEAAQVFFQHLANYETLFSLALSRRVEGDALISKHRNLKSSVDTLLVLQDGFQSNSHKPMYEAIVDSQKKISFIVDAIANAKSQTHLAPSDFRALMAVEDKHYSLDFAHDITLKAAALVSKDYSSLMSSKLAEPWMHLSDDPNKSDTVGVFWQVGGGNPHTIFKFKEDYLSFRLYSSAAFLMMGLANIPENSVPDRREEDLPVFSNALWYLGHFLQTDVFLESSEPDALKKQVLANLLIRTLNTMVNYAAMVRLEDFISDSLLSGKSVLPEDINTFYLRTLREFFKNSNMKIEEYWKHGWMNESFAFYGPHYASFYQAISAALAMKKYVHQKDPRVINSIQYGIAKSETHFSADVLNEAGIHLSSKQSYMDAIDEMYKLSQQLNAID